MCKYGPNSRSFIIFFPDGFNTEVHSPASPIAARYISLPFLMSRLVVYSVLMLTTLSYGLVLKFFLHTNFIFLEYLKLIGPNNGTG